MQGSMTGEERCARQVSISSRGLHLDDTHVQGERDAAIVFRSCRGKPVYPGPLFQFDGRVGITPPCLSEEERKELQKQLDSEEERRQRRKAWLRNFAQQVSAQALGTVNGGLALTLLGVLAGVIRNLGPADWRPSWRCW